MRSQILTQKRSAQYENSKFAILTNELHRRFLMMDMDISGEEKVQKVDHFTQQLVNSGYSWAQIRDIVVSSLKGVIKKEEKIKREERDRYRTGEQSLEERLRKHLIEATEWYKKGGRYEKEREKTGGSNIEGEERDSLRAWKGWRLGRKMGKKYKKIHDKVESEVNEIRGVLFIQHTENSTLAKRLRSRLKQFEEISRLRVRVVERTGDKLVDCIHKSNPWEAVDCKRKGCQFCTDEKMVGKCKSTGIVYEVECITCKKKN